MLKQFLQQLRVAALAIPLIIGLTIIAELLEPLQALHRLTVARRDTLLPIVIGMTALGFCAFMGSIIYKLLNTRSGEFRGEFSFHELKVAIRTGAWWHDHAWLFSSSLRVAHC
jgi:hypothetical protein